MADVMAFGFILLGFAGLAAAIAGLGRL